MKFKFKSLPHLFVKEQSDIKNNTVREIDLNDERFISLIKVMDNFVEVEHQIEISCTGVKNKSFERDIRDISVYKNLMIITWEPNR